MGNPINEVTKLGQSIWFDNIQRRSLENGEMKKLIEHVGIRGVTSNPSIFNNAISNSTDYDKELRRLASDGLSTEEIFWKLAVQDIVNAADLFLPLYDQTLGKDGFVSLEVSPDLAHDPKATLTEAKRLWNEVNRPNLMIKIPATKECLPAIRNAIGSGINVNVTLIFSVERYKLVFEAYLQGLKDRVTRGELISNVSSVASFFISRIDSKIDPQLEKDSNLKGKIAIASAKLAYIEFQKKFSGSEFTALMQEGGQLQRPLWASTSTKNKDYPDTLYVDELIGPNTVNTLPPATLKAFQNHGVAKLTIEQELQKASETFDTLFNEGISIEKVTDELEVEGVESFQNAFRDLLKAIENKRR